MLKFTLCKPMLIDTQIKEIEDKLPYSFKDLMDVNRCLKFLTKSSSGEFEIIPINQPISDKTDDATYYCGPEAIIELCKKYDVKIAPITEVDIPTEFYFESCPKIWDDVCYLVARAENRSSRLGKLLELDAPSIIIMNETRMLEEYLETLEHNNLYVLEYPDDPKHLEDKSGRIFRSLKDGGYSMVHGWDQEMLDKFEREYQKFVDNVEIVEEDSENDED